MTNGGEPPRTELNGGHNGGQNSAPRRAETYGPPPRPGTSLSITVSGNIVRSGAAVAQRGTTNHRKERSSRVACGDRRVAHQRSFSPSLCPMQHGTRRQVALPLCGTARRPEGESAARNGFL